MKRWQYIVFIVLAALFTAWWLVRDNFHAVIPGEVYRSAQLSGTGFADVIAEYGIRTIINLRRPRPEKSWYRDEIESSERLGVAHHDIGLDLTFSPRIDHLRRLRDLLVGAPRPLLFHCDAGADRTGLAAVMTRLLDGVSTLADAREQVSWKFHAVRENSLGIPFFNAYSGWLQTTGQRHSPDNFNHWLDYEYVDLSGNTHFLVDPIRGQTWWRPWGRIGQDVEFEVRRDGGDTLDLSGWAFDTRHETLLRGVELRLGDGEFRQAAYDIPQPWLINDFDIQAWLDSGWALSLPLHNLDDGCRDLQLRFTRLDGSTWTSPPAARVCIE